jgi:hypothetical protein
MATPPQPPPPPPSFVTGPAGFHVAPAPPPETLRLETFAYLGAHSGPVGLVPEVSTMQKSDPVPGHVHPALMNF